MKSVKMTERKKKVNDILSDEEYNAVMQQIDTLMGKGSTHLTKREMATVRRLAMKAQAYEQKTFAVDPPTTLAGIIEMRMYDLRLKQTQLAQKLNISDAKLSLIMSGKQRPDVAFLKTVHKELNIDANLLLEAV